MQWMMLIVAEYLEHERMVRNIVNKRFSDCNRKLKQFIQN